MTSQAQTRFELIAALSQLIQLRPEWRFGQMVANLAMTAGRFEAGAVWDLEDDEALAAARMLIGQYAEMDSSSAEAATAPDRGGTR
jgi:hypothetical protein